MFKICDDSYAFGHTCFSNHTVRKVWCAPPFGFDEPVRGSSERGSAMHMILPDGIGREADRENPEQEGAKDIPGLPVMTGPP